MSALPPRGTIFHPVDRVREEMLIRRQTSNLRLPVRYPPAIPPPAYSPSPRRISVIAMWAQSARSERDGREEWVVFYTTKQIRLEPLEDEDDEEVLRAGDMFDILLFDRGGNMHDYMSLRTEHMEEPDSPLSITLQTRNADNTEIRLRIPIACVSMTLTTLLSHINECNDDGEIDVFPTILITEETYRDADRNSRFLSQEARNRLDPYGGLDNYALILPFDAPDTQTGTAQTQNAPSPKNSHKAIEEPQKCNSNAHDAAKSLEKWANTNLTKRRRIQDRKV
ncbi:hypothetical protein H0H93_007186 [Arthromyces matolae]|nr:hypothetical protein H0H93_007186 [Arthromyces matolae]